MSRKEYKETDFTYDIVAFLGSIKESDKHDWCKGVTKMKWGDNPVTLDIRNMNMSEKRIGKGISLTNEETDKLVNLLLENDYGDLDNIAVALSRRKSLFTLSTGGVETALGSYVIDIQVD